MARAELQANVDYFYCEECKKQVPCIRLEPGVWEVQCPRCVGECGLCGCHLAGYCFGKGQVRVKTHMYIVQPKTRTLDKSGNEVRHVSRRCKAHVS